VAGVESIPIPFGPPCGQNCPHRKPNRKVRERRENAIVQTEGMKPEGCIMVNANWCGLELPLYHDEATCRVVRTFLHLPRLPRLDKENIANNNALTNHFFQASQNCWKQNDVCYKSAPPTGSTNCGIWGNMCVKLDTLCQRGDYHLRPYSGKDLTPELPPLTGKMDVFERSLPKLQDTVKRV
jgi:hypothetical protein